MTKLLTTPLEALCRFRRRRLFLLPSEHDAALLQAANKIADAYKTKRAELRASLLALASAKLSRTRTCYEIKLTVNHAALDTCVGDEAAVDIAVALTKQIVAKHRASIETGKRASEKRNNHKPTTTHE